MKKSAFLSLLLTAIMWVFLLVGCTSNSTQTTDMDDEVQTEEDTTGLEYPGFEVGSTIGVSLPWLGTQNWTEAEELFASELVKAGYVPIIQEADQTVTKQQQQISSMIESGAKVIVVGPVDSAQLGDVLEEARDNGIYIIGYDRLLENTTGVDGVVQFSSIKTGELQAETLIAGLEEKKGDAPYRIELFGGGPSDPNSLNFFIGAMSVLQPEIDDGTIIVESNQTDFIECAIADWNNEKAFGRMASLLNEYYSDKEIDGVLCPNDGIARSCITACENNGQDIPVVSGLDAENESVEWIWNGKQYSTIAKPTKSLVAKTLELISSLQQGNGMPATNSSVDNGEIEVPVYELDPIVVTKDNIEEVFADDPERSILLN